MVLDNWLLNELIWKKFRLLAVSEHRCLRLQNWIIGDTGLLVMLLEGLALHVEVLGLVLVNLLVVALGWLLLHVA